MTLAAVPVRSGATRRRLSLAVASLVALGISGLSTPAAAAPPDTRTRVIVQLTPGADPRAEARGAAAVGGEVSHVYRNVFPGFAGEFSARAVEALRRNPRVQLIEADGAVTASATQTGPTWGLDRIDQASLPLDGSYSHPDAAGDGVTAYVLDTGITDSAGQFTGRLSSAGYSAFPTGGTADCDGHGTHVAGTIASTSYGVAKQANLVPVRVLDCNGSGSWSGVIAGLDYVVGHHASGVPAVANMSLGGGANRSVDTAVSKAVRDGVTVAVAAGNSNANACQTSPARVTEALTVGATSEADQRASFSNYGSCLDLFAPGVNITSTWHTAPVHTISGTSMAAPHVAGAAALILAGGHLPPADVATRLINTSTPNTVTNAGSRSPNRLLHVEHPTS